MRGSLNFQQNKHSYYSEKCLATLGGPRTYLQLVRMLRRVAYNF